MASRRLSPIFGRARIISAGPASRAPHSDAARNTALPGLGVEPQDLEIALELPSNEAVRAAVEAGAGVTVISKLVVASSLKAGSLVAVDIELPKRHFLALRHKERYVTHAAREFYGLATDGLGGRGTASMKSTQSL